MNIFNKLSFFCKKNAPELFLGAGIAGVVGTVIFACKGTLKLDYKLQPINSSIKNLDYSEPSEEVENLRKQLKKDARKEAIKAYAPAAGLFVLSVSCLLASYNIQKAREAAISAAYIGLKESFDAYRGRVKEKLGEEEEQKIYGTQEVKKIDEKGKEVTERDICPPGFFDIMFDSTCGSWYADIANYDNLMFECQQLNNILNGRGYVTVADVYKALGVRINELPKQVRHAARLFGWVKDKDHFSYISFGLTDSNGYLLPEILNAKNKGVLEIPIRLNPDGNIYSGDFNIADAARSW